MKKIVLSFLAFLMLQFCFSQKALTRQGYFSYNEIKDITTSTNAVITATDNSFREQHTSGSKQISDSLNQALKASMQMYVPADERENQRPLKPSLKMASASPHRNNTSKKESKNGNKKGGLKNKLKSVLGRNKSPKQRPKKVTVCHEL